MARKTLGLKANDNNTIPTSVAQNVAPSTPPPHSGQHFIREDGWENALKGFGGSRDSRSYTTFAQSDLLIKDTLNGLYTSDGLVRRIVDLVPEEIFRVQGTIQNDPTDEYDEGIITHEMNRLNATTALKTAKKMARLTGGSIIYIGAMGSGSPDTPLNANKITNIEFLKVFDLNDIQTWDCEFDTDISSPNFGKISTYSIKVKVGNTSTVHKVHASRCIPFYGSHVPPNSAFGSLLEVRHWGVSILQYMYPDIRDYRISFANTAKILEEFIIGKYKFEDLDEILASGNEKKLQSRIAGIELSKSIINAVMLGTNEEYTRDSASVAGLSDLLDRFMMLVSSATGYPVTKLFGRSASGLNATGEGDQKSYYDMLRSEMVDLQPYVQKLVDIFVAWKKLPDGDYTFEFGNLYQPTAHEEADRQRVVAETLRTNMDAAQRALADGVLTPEQVYNLYYRDLTGEEYQEDTILQQQDLMEVDNEADIVGGVKEEDKDNSAEITTDALPQEIPLDLSYGGRKGILQRIKAIFRGNRK